MSHPTLRTHAVTTTLQEAAMLLRRTVLAGALALAACAPGVPYDPPPAAVAFALWDPSKSEIPQPNDLVLQQDPTTLGLPPAQAEMLAGFKAAGGFPSDQAVGVTLDFARNRIDAVTGKVAREAAKPDPASFTANTFFVYGVTASGSGLVPLDPITADDVTVSGDKATLTLHHEGRLPWAPGQYMVFVRGGPNGVRTDQGETIWPSPIFYLLTQGKDLTAPENIGLIRAQVDTMDEALATAGQLKLIMGLYAKPFAVADTRFPHSELAVMTTFAVQPAPTQVDLDPGRGLVPLPIDLIRDPRPGGKITALGACALAGGHLKADGTCSSSSAGFFASLDGFSTTAPILAPTNAYINALTVTSSTVFLYDLTNPASPVLVDPTTYIHAPCEFANTCGAGPRLTTAVALQPAGASAGDATSVFRTRPLKDATNYAVVISDGVKDKTGAPLGIGTIGRILLFDNPLIKDGASQLVGVDAPTAGALEVMRQQLRPVVAAVAGKGVAKAHIAMAYTFRTQSITGLAAQLGALPYGTPAATALPDATVTALTPAEAFRKYGVDGSLVPSGSIKEVLEAKITTFDLLDPATGAFRADLNPMAKKINVLIAVPKVTSGTPVVSPLMVFRHGLGGGRADMLLVADGFAAKGLVTVAIDAEKHGDRSYCAKGDTKVEVGGVQYNVCADGAACTSALPAGAQADAKPPGTCAAGFTKRPVMSSCAPGSCWSGADGIPLASSSFLISANFFRTRDSLRQDIIDQSQLVRVMAQNPLAPPTGHAIFDALMADKVVIDPTAINYTGISLGALQGVMDVAANPRIGKAVFNVGGGTLVDIFTNSPAFKPGVEKLLAGMGIVPGTSQYLQFLAVAKLILDPADPINFAGHLSADTLPNLLVTPNAPMAAKKVLTQLACWDVVVPNVWGMLLSSNAGRGPLPGFPGFGGPGTFQLFMKGAAIPTAGDIAACLGSTPPAGAVPHSFMADWSNSTRAGKAQADAAAFVVSDTLAPTLVVLP